VRLTPRLGSNTLLVGPRQGLVKGLDTLLLLFFTHQAAASVATCSAYQRAHRSCGCAEAAARCSTAKAKIFFSNWARADSNDNRGFQQGILGRVQWTKWTYPLPHSRKAGTTDDLGLLLQNLGLVLSLRLVFLCLQLCRQVPKHVPALLALKLLRALRLRSLRRLSLTSDSVQDQGIVLQNSHNQSPFLDTAGICVRPAAFAWVQTTLSFTLNELMQPYEISY
jgi:hypothetical protein